MVMSETAADQAAVPPASRPDLASILLGDHHHRRPRRHALLGGGPAGGGVLEPVAFDFRRVLDVQKEGFAVGGEFGAAHFGADGTGEEELYQGAAGAGEVA